MKINFVETSYMASGLLIGIGALATLLLLGIVWYMRTKKQKTGSYITAGVLVLVVGMFAFVASSSLTLQIDGRGVEYKFSPFINTPQLIAWKDIKSAEVVTYNPMHDYGGWGLRHSSKGKAYNTQGDKGLQLLLQNGKKILFTVIDVEKAKQTLEELKEEKAR